MYGNVKCVTHSELVDGGVITQAQYINYSKRRQFVFHQRGGNGRIALIDYNSLPAPYVKGTTKSIPMPKSN